MLLMHPPDTHPAFSDLHKACLLYTSGMERNEKDEKTGKFVRQERYSGSCQRSFYVGEGVKQEDMKARFEDGILHLEFPKASPKQVEESHRILIE